MKDFKSNTLILTSIHLFSLIFFLSNVWHFDHHSILIPVFMVLTFIGYIFILIFIYWAYHLKDPSTFVVGMYFRIFFYTFELVVWIGNQYLERFIISIFMLIIQANILSVLLSNISDIVLDEKKESDIENDLLQSNLNQNKLYEGPFGLIKHLYFFSACMPMVGPLMNISVKKKSD
eukprot:TRINITY_DN14556_c0_g1_i1.p1 TRINITY_DN14556_c0_g1~~TRINITY_DN14556_c0_g1_i1.p1  ORF type:complete len:176 (-),score=13.08 TRINITY_DN14556_c0_g1_i1:111-638(-)